MNCPCNPNKSYQDCCEVFHNNEKLPSTCLELMRSRYSAFSLKKFDYLKNTFTTGLFSKKQIQANEEWAQSVQFTKLEILFHEENQKTGKVEFKAYFYELGIPESTIENASEKTEQCHHEKSKFRKQNEKWLYDGVYLS